MPTLSYSFVAPVGLSASTPRLTRAERRGARTPRTSGREGPCRARGRARGGGPRAARRSRTPPRASFRTTAASSPPSRTTNQRDRAHRVAGRAGAPTTRRTGAPCHSQWSWNDSIIAAWNAAASSSRNVVENERRGELRHDRLGVELDRHVVEASHLAIAAAAEERGGGRHPPAAPTCASLVPPFGRRRLAAIDESRAEPASLRALRDDAVVRADVASRPRTSRPRRRAPSSSKSHDSSARSVAHPPRCDVGRPRRATAGRGEPPRPPERARRRPVRRRPVIGRTFTTRASRARRRGRRACAARRRAAARAARRAG